MSTHRGGFTIVELAVVASIMTILTGILVPFVHQAREGARRTVCLNNLAEIGMASQMYDDSLGQLPPYMGLPFNSEIGEFFAEAPNYQLTYSLVQLLDFVGQSELADMVDPFAFDGQDATIAAAGYSSFAGAWLPGINEQFPGINALVFDIQIKEFVCPSDFDAPRDSVYFGIHPTNTANVGTFFLAPVEDTEYSVTNYVGNMGGVAITDTPTGPLMDLGFIGFHGPIQSRQSDSAEQIPDGASNVMLFGESLGEIDPQANINRRHSMAMGGLAVGRPTVYVGMETVFGNGKRSDYFQFGSMHPMVVNAVRADASTLSVHRMVDDIAMGRFCGVADGAEFNLEQRRNR